jgi:poly(3-hydroxybutyrate) depolymerase
MRAINLLLLLAAAALSSAEPSPGCSQPQTSGSWTNEVPFDGGSYTHAYTYPDSASEDNPAPLILFFHGWGGSSSDCGNSCNTATKRGYATIAMTGIGEEYGELNSWNGFGSTSSNTGAALPEALVAGDEYCSDEKENDRTCNLDAYELGCYADCESCADECWWTTCKDSVQQTVDVLEDFISRNCVDMDRIYAAGWSNGGTFMH